MQSSSDLPTELPVFRHNVRVYYEDTDAAGVVYYANYLKFIERARSEWLRSISIELDQLERHEGTVFAVHSLNARYNKPARLGDLLEVTARLDWIGRVSIELWQTVCRGDDHLFSCRVRLACVDSETFRPKPIPASMRDQIHPWKQLK
jgi:acyl-CoA thioester hydrolase